MKIGIDAKWYISGPPSGNTVVRNLIDNLINLKGFQLILFVNKKDIKNNVKEFISLKNKSNIKIIEIPKGYLPNFVQNTFLLPFYYKKLKLDVILFQNFIPLWGNNHLKTIAYIHDFLFVDFPQYFSSWELLIYKFIVRSAKHADHIITISNSEKQRIMRYCSLKENNISFVYHGVSCDFKPLNDDEKNIIKEKYNLPPNYILYVGRLNQRKNISTLIKSLKYLDDENIKLVIIGSESNKAFNLLEYSRNHGVQEKIVKLGYVNYEKLKEVLGSASVFVFPSYAEGFGLPPLEAMKSGIPTIVSDQTSLPEVCSNGALYFNVNSEIELAQKINLIMTNNELRNDLIEKGKKQASKFQWEKSANEIFEILKKVLLQ